MKRHKLIYYGMLFIIITLIAIVMIFYHQIYVIIYDIFNNNLAMGWSSGIGSFSAALSALGIALYNHKSRVREIHRKRISRIKIIRFIDSKYKCLKIEFVNISERTDFVRLIHVGYLDAKNRRSMYVETPLKLKRYELYHAVNENSTYTWTIRYKDIKPLLEHIKCIKNDDNIILLTFKDLLYNKISVAPIRREDLKDVRGYVDLLELD